MQAINIDKFYQYTNWLAAKNITGGYIPPNTFNLVMPICVNQMVRKYYGVPELYQPGAPMPPIGYEITQLVTDYLSQLKSQVILNIDAQGTASKPANYLHKSSISASWVEVLPITEGDEAEDGDCCPCDDIPTLQTTKKKKAQHYLDVQWVPVTVVTDAERWAYLQSSLRKPTKEYPICTFLNNDTIQFYPQNMKSVWFTYLRYPTAPFWAYTIAPDGYPTYNPAGSIDIELPEMCMDELAATLLNRIGISVREQGLSNWAMATKNAGV
jgi:hypothetical protein